MDLECALSFRVVFVSITEAVDGPADGLSVAQISELTGVSGYTLRYYERAGLIQSVARTGGNQRRYQAADVEWVRFLLRLRETGMPIAQMREYATLRAQGDATLQPRLAMLVEHQEALHRQIATLRAHERALAVKIGTYRQLIADAGVPSPSTGTATKPKAEVNDTRDHHDRSHR